MNEAIKEKLRLKQQIKLLRGKLSKLKNEFIRTCLFNLNSYFMYYVEYDPIRAEVVMTIHVC